MRYKVDHDLHIHTQLSSCSNDPEQNAQALLDYAKANGLSRICVTDHYWDREVKGASDWYKPQDFDHISEIKPLPQSEGIEFLFGAETEFTKDLRVAMPRSRYGDFDFVIIPTTHLHMNGLTIAQSDVDSPDTNIIRARLWVSRLEGLLSQDLPFHKIGIAHLACGLNNNRGTFEDYLCTINAIPDADMERLFALAAERGCGIELNQDDILRMMKATDEVCRMFRIAKGMGCKFYMGSDAHHPKSLIFAKERFEYAVDTLGLCESDKFIIGG